MNDKPVAALVTTSVLRNTHIKIPHTRHISHCCYSMGCIRQTWVTNHHQRVANGNEEEWEVTGKKAGSVNKPSDNLWLTDVRDERRTGVNDAIFSGDAKRYLKVDAQVQPGVQS